MNTPDPIPNTPPGPLQSASLEELVDEIERRRLTFVFIAQEPSNDIDEAPFIFRTGGNDFTVRGMIGHARDEHRADMLGETEEDDDA